MRAMALGEDIRRELDCSLTLGVARYLKEHPEAEARGSSWRNADVDRWLARSSDEIADEARRRLEELDRLRERAAEDAAGWESARIDYLNARLNLENVASGAFLGAAGGLHDFLRDVGAEVSSFDVG